MDATDHENIPTANHGSLYSSLIHNGFDYLNQEKQLNMHKVAETSKSLGSIHKVTNESQKNYLESSEKCKPFGWFYKNLFPEEQIKKMQCDESKPKLEPASKNNVHPIKHSAHKKYILSNFDLNALSPNSW